MVNNARRSLTDIPADKIIEQREYGDPSLIVSRIVSGVLGDSVEVVIPEMAEAMSAPPSTQDKPADPGDEADDIEKALYAATVEVWTAEKMDAIERWKTARESLPSLKESADWIDWWMDVEHVIAKITEAEAEYAVALGDSVYGLAWSTEKARPTLSLYPPDAYMPELDDDGFPSKVHLVWQEPSDDEEMPEAQLVRRITYELLDVDDWSPGYQPESANVMCAMTDVTFNLADYSDTRWKAEGENVLEWSPSLGEIAENEDGEKLLEYFLGIDFLPIIHVPNTPATVEHFGRSSLARVARLLDDIVGTDTDIQRAAALAGSPVLGLKGANVDPNKPIDIFPGKVFGLGADGALDHIDMSPSVVVLRDTQESLLERLSVNVQIPESMMGRLDETRQFPSGVALRMSFQSFIQLIDTLRLAREPKFRLLLKMAQRLHVANGGTDHKIVAAELNFGEFIPADVESTTLTVSQLLTANGISRATAARMLQEVGVPIEDVMDEVHAINREDTAGAKNAADATGSEQVAAELLGVDIDEAEALPAVTTGLPPANPQLNLNGPPSP